MHAHDPCGVPGPSDWERERWADPTAQRDLAELDPRSHAADTRRAERDRHPLVAPTAAHGRPNGIAGKQIGERARLGHLLEEDDVGTNVVQRLRHAHAVVRRREVAQVPATDAKADRGARWPPLVQSQSYDRSCAAGGGEKGAATEEHFAIDVATATPRVARNLSSALARAQTLSPRTRIGLHPR